VTAPDPLPGHSPEPTLPCPFCGQDAIGGGYGIEDPYVGCTDESCAGGKAWTPLSAWNRRTLSAAHAALARENEGLKRVLGSVRSSIRLVCNRDKINEWTMDSLREAEREIDRALAAQTKEQT
jgi:hypothetical protein